MKMRTIGLALCAVILSHGAVAQTPEQIKGLEEAQKQIADRLKPKLPLKLDAYTTLTEVSVEGMMLIYTYTVDTDKITLAPDFIALSKQASVREACGAANMENMRFGAAYRHRFFDAQGTLKGSYELRLADCG